MLWEIRSYIRGLKPASPICKDQVFAAAIAGHRLGIIWLSHIATKDNKQFK